jgi:hypothetical protein
MITMNQLLTNAYSPFLFLSPQRIKFLLFVDQYEFISPALSIFYDPVTYLPTFIIDRLHQEYRADFLIRHRETGEALLVDLFPLDMACGARMFLRRRIAERYIAWKGYDWEYRCLFQEYIMLTPNENVLFETYGMMNSDEDRRKWLLDYMAMVTMLKPSAFQFPNYSLLDFNSWCASFSSLILLLCYPHIKIDLR